MAETLVYRSSRHPQYLGWIVWSYGVYLLLDFVRYPKRSWGISGSLPWLLPTMVIIAVAMLEELRMARRFEDAYETYGGEAPRSREGTRRGDRAGALDVVSTILRMRSGGRG